MYKFIAIVQHIFDKKMALVDRFYDLLVNKYGIAPSDIIFDLLVFTVDSGNDEKLKGTSQATIEAIRAVKKKYPDVSTILGISNVSFGLPPAGREVLNSVFFYHSLVQSFHNLKKEIYLHVDVVNVRRE